MSAKGSKPRHRLFFVAALLALLPGCISCNTDPMFVDFLKEPPIVSVKPYLLPEYRDLADEEKYAEGMSKERYERLVERIRALPYRFHDVTYLSDGLRVKAIAGFPKDLKPPHRAPLVVAVRGGNRSLAPYSLGHLPRLASLYGGSGKRAFLALNFRGSPGAEGKDEFGGQDVNDVLTAIEFGRRLPSIDVKNIFLAGWSRGGMMVFLALKQGAQVNAAIALAAPTDLTKYREERPDKRQVYEELIPGFTADPEKTLRERSALFWPELLKSPLLLLYGEKDWQVPVRQAREFGAALTRVKRTHELVIYPNEGHDLENVSDDVQREFEAWVEKYSIR